MLADGHTDEFYLRFASPKQTSLILGTSRAAQGIVPKVIKAKSNKEIYNFAFTLVHSPYGPVYYNAICKKLKEGTKDGLFILVVDPWSISAKQENPNDTTQFFEKSLSLGTTSNFNQHPNIEYLFESYNGTLSNLIKNKFIKEKQLAFLHEDGWLELPKKWDSTTAKKRAEEKLTEYRETNLPYYKYSSIRLAYLNKTIRKLKQYGSVFLVRVPIPIEMKEIEDLLLPNFDTLMLDLSQKDKVPYFNFADSGNNYKYNDGNHLNVGSALQFSQQLVERINEYRIE
jgi:hypothetical protein